MKFRLLLMLLVMLLPSGIHARDFTYTYEGKTLTYTVVDETAKTCITKNGSFGSNNNYPGNKCTGNVSIPSKVSDGVNEYTVTGIGMYGFDGNSSLTSVDIPNTVTSIGSCAFNRCSRLTSVTIPNSVTSIYHSAFKDCSSLTSVNIPNSVTSIGSSAFCRCISLISIDIPNSVTLIDFGTFSECSNLTSVNIPNSVTSINYRAFEGHGSFI